MIYIQICLHPVSIAYRCHGLPFHQDMMIMLGSWPVFHWHRPSTLGLFWGYPGLILDFSLAYISIRVQ